VSNVTPYSTPASQFIVEVDGEQIGTFAELEGLNVQVEVHELIEGGQNQFVHKLPGRMIWPNLVLRRGITNSDSFFAWLGQSSGDGFAGAGNKLERTTAAVIMTDAAGNRLRTWNVEGAFPVRWVGPSFVNNAEDVAIEELEIAHHGFRAAQS
jgi:phage tail-like protein